jgi:hypothetical protein
MNFKPILFSTPMVKAIRDGKKTQTRRVIKDGANRTPQNIGREKFFKMVNALNNKPFFGAGFYKDSDVFEYKGEILTDAVYFKCPYKPGDVLWVRETWCTHEDMADVFENQLRPGYYYKANEIGKEWVNDREIVKWRPSIFMPRKAARIFLRVLNVRVERLQDITPKDAWDEGCRIGNSFPWEEHIPELQQQCRDILFIPLWDNLNAKRGYGWDKNPWVWVISFERCEKPEAL